MAIKEITNPMDDKNLNKFNFNFILLYQMQNKINAILNDLVLESGGTSNLEVVQARGGKPVLNARLNEIEDKTAQANAKANDPLGAIQTQGKLITLDMLGADVKGAMSGDTEITNAEGYLENNRGVMYPLENITRGGSIYAVSQEVKDVILDVKVFNPNPLKYYRIDFISNGHKDSWGFSISEYDKSTYATTGDGDYLCRYDDEIGMKTNPNSSVSTQSVVTDGITFLITLDYSEIKSTSLNLNNINNGYGMVIDESCYFYQSEKDYRTEQLYPLKNIKRGGEVKTYDPILKEILMDAWVKNADKNKYYVISWISNGYNDSYGVSIKEFDKNSFETDSNSGGITIRHYRDDIFDNLEYKGISVLNITTETGADISLMIDYSKIKDEFINISSTSIGVGMGLVIDESRYFYKSDSTPSKSGVIGAKSVVKVVDDKTFLVKTSYSDTQNIIYKFSNLGINEITHLKEILLQDKTSDILDDDFIGTVFNTVTTDWISPYRIEALQNSNGNERLTTGGNHGSDGGGGGYPTARPLDFEIYADGLKVRNGETVFANEKVIAKVKNRVTAFNAINLDTGEKRDSLEEIVTYTFTPNVLAVNNEMVALEDLKFHYHQGLGLTKAKWNKYLYMMEDNANETVRDVSDNVAGSSGTVEQGVLANRVILKKDGHGLAMYYDSDYGLGTLEHLEETSAPIFYSASKVYGRTIGVDKTVNVTEGDSLTIAGGYVFTKGLKCEGAEFAHKMSLKGKKAYAVDFFDAVNSTYLEVDEEDIGKEIKVWKKSDTITHDNFITSRGLKIKSTGYGQLLFTVE